MQVLASTGDDNVAVVYVVEFDGGKRLECVESVQPPLPRTDKWVLLVSTMYGCPVGCKMCDAGGFYHGKPSKAEIFAQLDFLVQRHYPDGRIPCRQFKIQFARMGEPTLNPAVLEVLRELPQRYQAPGLLPSISTVAPAGAARFLEQLLEIKQTHYAGGHFQFQFSIHTTDTALRDEMIPVKKWSFAQMAAYGERFYAPGDRKLTLNFALAQGMPIDPAVLRQYFDPERFLIKITPLNPTYRAAQNQLQSYIEPSLSAEAAECDRLLQALRAAGYTVLLSIGEAEENQIGSNCGQYLATHLAAAEPLADGYTYAVQQL
jgi:23S rRNA (adenine2503-C2)-methyltransferase